MNVKDASFNRIINSAADLLSNSDFISRTIGMNNSYEDIMFIVQALGREPIGLLGKDYAFIFDHVRRNFQQGYSVSSVMYGGGEYGCPKFTFYKEVPTVRFADPYSDPLNLLDRWVSNFKTEDTMVASNGGGTSIHYSESNDGLTNNKKIGYKGDLDSGNPGTYINSIYSYGPSLGTCDLIKKTNDNFNHGKYKTLVARFHTNSEDSKDSKNPTQTAISPTYGMSHGRNLLKLNPSTENGYDNPYCRVWTYHHQYNQISRLIRPLVGEGGEGITEEILESYEKSGNYETIGFRTKDGDDFKGGSKRLDKYGVLNYKNGFVNIAPTAKIKDYFEKKEDDEDVVSVKRCMFSIENLAWRDEKTEKYKYDQYGLSPEQKGPLGGRIMWFPPYDLSFSEDVRVDWNGNKFIGRGEQIYTYTNTDRSGNLSFTLLIDHPSIIDYWTGRDWKNGGKNQGRDLKEGNDGGIDEKYNQENTLLRFFAGCEILSAKPQLFKERTKTTTPPKDDELEVPPMDKVTEPDEVPEPKKKQIQVLLFYPNNYSGKDDGSNSVNPVWYLMNGVGTQKYINESTKYAEDIPTTLGTQPSVFDENGITVQFDGGYEMMESQAMTGGISLTFTNLNADHEDIKKTYADLVSKERKGQYLTSPDGTKYKVTYGSTTYDLAKIVGSKAMGLGEAYEPNLSGKDHLWYRKRYYYRVDKAYENQDFSNSDSYLDIGSFALNSVGYTNARSVKEFEIEDDSDIFKLYSFADLFTALESSNNAVKVSDESKKIKEILTNKDKYRITNLKYFGHASYQGRKSSNNDLAKNRANTLKKWLESFDQFKDVQHEEPIIKNQSEKPVINVGGNSELNTKLWRSASVIIEYDETDVSSASDTNASPTVEKVEIPNKETSKNNILTVKDWLDRTPEGQAFKKDYPELAAKGNSTFFGTLTWDEISEKTGKDYFNQYSWNYDDSYLNRGITVSEEKVVERYDNEGEFFELLTKEAPILHNLISQKIRYFDPAFHSISPEGFNARLTFLHQCTRQGSTIEHGNPNEISAYNLAFGRPPICVLRLGDFYYTKIIINSLNIQYENPQWDLNPEGIGVMPMFAKVSINFTFLGGSDLAGPIARLQNAVSFNYYANASVYDNRAEMVEYDPEGSGKPIKFKGYVYPNQTRDGSANYSTPKITAFDKTEKNEHNQDGS